MATRGQFVETTWVNGAAPGISAQQLQRIEDQVAVLDEIWDGDQSQAPDGTAAAPTYSFDADTDTGMYHYEGNAIGFATGGALQFLIRSNDIITYNPFQVQNGSAANPSLTFQQDSDTGLYRYAANRLGFTTGGVLRAIATEYGFTVGGNTAPTVTSNAFTVTSASNRAAGHFYRKTATSNQTVLLVASNIGGTMHTNWYVDSDGDAIKSSDPKLKTYMKPARSYWDDWRRLDADGALIQHGWKGAKDKARLTNWDAAKVKKVFPKLAPTIADEDGAEHLMVNYSALDLIAHRVLMEAVKRIERLESAAKKPAAKARKR